MMMQWRPRARQLVRAIIKRGLPLTIHPECRRSAPTVSRPLTAFTLSPGTPVTQTCGHGVAGSDRQGVAGDSYRSSVATHAAATAGGAQACLPCVSAVGDL